MSSHSQGSADLAPVTDHWDAATITDEKGPAHLPADPKGLGRTIELGWQQLNSEEGKGNARCRF
jgi:hypothetical protein